MAKQSEAARSQKGDDQNSARDEAKHLAEEAVQELRKGNKEEADFVLGAARELDKGAVDEVVKSQGKKS